MKKDHEKNSGNVFADLGLPNSDQELLKAKLTVEIYRLIKARGLTQTDAARLLGTTQAQVSALMRCRPVSAWRSSQPSSFHGSPRLHQSCSTQGHQHCSSCFMAHSCCSA